MRLTCLSCSSAQTDDSNVPTNATHCFMECYSGVSIWAKDVKKGNRVFRVRLFNIQCPVIRDVFLDSGHFATKRAYYILICTLLQWLLYTVYVS